MLQVIKTVRDRDWFHLSSIFLEIVRLGSIGSAIVRISDTMTPHLTPEVRQIIERVLQLERDRLDRKKNSPINDDILKIVKEAVI